VTIGILLKPPFRSRCMVCHIPLPDEYYEERGEPYCMEHFYEKAAHKCRKCGDYITGPTMVRGCVRTCDGHVANM
jgi:hypothetical protein